MKVLIISPHTDDGELGCGGTIARLVREGHEVTLMCFSSCGKKELENEMHKSAEVLGVQYIMFERCEIPVRHFFIYKPDILQFMYIYRDDYDMVFCPSSDDIHQDHQVINQEAKRAFKHTKLLGYELPWNSQGFKGNCFYEINGAGLKMKNKALSKYKSQAQRKYFNLEFIESLARVRGVQAGCEFAECFEVIRWYG